MSSKRHFKVTAANGDILAYGVVSDTAARVNNTAILAGVALAQLYGTDPVSSVTAGKKDDASGLRPLLKLKFKEGEAKYKAAVA